MEPFGGAAVVGALIIMARVWLLELRTQPSVSMGWRVLERGAGSRVTHAPTQWVDLLQHNARHSDVAQVTSDLENLAGPPVTEENLTDLKRARRAKLWVFEAAENLMSDQKLYQQPNVTLAVLAAKLNTSTRCLSASIGHYAGQSFRDYVNTYRVIYARKALRQPAPDRPSITEVISEAGFSSPTTFYAAFKRQWGMTPRQCVEQARMERARQRRADAAQR